MFTKTCQNCSKQFGARNKDYKYCSQSCAAKVNNKLAIKRKKEGICRICMKETNASKTYCIECFESGQWRRKAMSTVEKKKRSSKNVVSWRQRTKLKAIEYMGGSCKTCGYHKCSRALTFHHLNPYEKDFTISGKSLSWERIKLELDKCILICANCHAEEHEAEYLKSKLLDLESDQES